MRVGDGENKNYLCKTNKEHWAKMRRSGMRARMDPWGGIRDGGGDGAGALEIQSEVPRAKQDVTSLAEGSHQDAVSQVHIPEVTVREDAATANSQSGGALLTPRTGRV